MTNIVLCHFNVARFRLCELFWTCLLVYHFATSYRPAVMACAELSTNCDWAALFCMFILCYMNLTLTDWPVLSRHPSLSLSTIANMVMCGNQQLVQIAMPPYSPSSLFMNCYTLFEALYCVVFVVYRRRARLGTFGRDKFRHVRRNVVPRL